MSVILLQHQWELDTLMGFYSALKPKKVMEIGAYAGGTLQYWLKEKIEELIVIDLPRTDPPAPEGRKQWLSWFPTPFTFHYFQGDSTSPKLINNVVRTVPDKDIDFLFIDGGHTYPVVKSDFENYSRLVRKGGIIALHDIVPNSEQYGVNKFWKEFKSKNSNHAELIQEGMDHDRGIGLIFV